MSKIELFTLNKETRLAELNKEWISTIKEFKAIVKRDKGVAGDTQARQKLQATRELTFIYHYCDYGSKFANYEEAERKKAALRNSELSEDLDIEADNDLMSAIIMYKSLQMTPSLKTLEEVKATLYSAYKVSKKIREYLESKLDDLDIDEYKEKSVNGRIVQVSSLETIKNSLDYVMTLSTKLPKNIESLEALEEKLKKEMSEEGGLRGKKDKGVREDGVTGNNVNQANVKENLMEW